MGETAQFIKIKDVIYYYADEAQLSTAAFRRLQGIAVRGAMDLLFDVTGEETGAVKSVEICVDANKTAQLPEDYINWSKVGILNSRGEVATLKHNPQLTTMAANNPKRLSKIVDASGPPDLSLPIDLFYLNFSNPAYGYYGVTLFGLSGNELLSEGSFEIDKDCGTIVLNPNFNHDYIILEYLSLPDENFKVPIMAQEALIAWIAWKDINQLAASRKVSVYDKTERKRAYFREKNLARNRLVPFILQDAIDASQDAIRLVPKG